MKYAVLFFLALPAMGQTLIDQHMLPLENEEANRLYREGKVEDALKIYQDLYGQDTENGALAYNLGNAYAARGEMEKAAEFYEKAARSQHEEARLRSRFNMGNIQMAAEQPGEALKNYVDYLRNRPDDVDAKRNLELALRKLQQQEQQQQEQQQQEDGGEDQEQEQQQQQQQQDEKQEEQKDEQQQEQDQQQQQDQQQSQGSEDEQKEEQEQQQQQQEQKKDQEMSEEMKQQILEALKEQEQQQQKEHQKRKIGKTKRRAKDW